jgi:hypothetical protein
LRDLKFGAILNTEQIDVRRFLLADSLIAPDLERRDSLHFLFSSFDFRISLKKDLPWLH